VPLFLFGKVGEFASTIDQSRLLLRSPEPAAEVRWAESLVVRPAARLLDPAGDPLAVMLTACYDTAFEPPAGAVLRLSLRAADGTTLPSAAETPAAKLPAVATLPVAKLPVGDHTLRAEIVASGKVLAASEQMISVVPRFQERLDRLQTAALAVNTNHSTDTATLRSLTNLLASLAEQHPLETDYPAVRLFAEADALARAVAAKVRFHGPLRPGEFWMTLFTEAGSEPVRLFVPEAVRAGKPVPLLVVLHGAGGSENLYFDGYGDGKTVRLAKERGWMVVGTRVGAVFGGPPPVPAVIDELAKLYPVDKQRVYAIGHSLGATHAVTLAQQAPGRFAALAVLGGGASVTKPDALKGLPVYVGCGAHDFALGTCQGLAQALEKAGAKVTYREFTDVEHITIVQDSLKELFAFFEKK
jgi:predicted esterase